MNEAEVRVRMQRSGGFAGIVRTADVSSATLPPDQAADLRRVVEQADPGPGSAGQPVIPDGFRYELDIWHGTTHTHFTVADPAVSASVRELIAVVQRLAV